MAPRRIESKKKKYINRARKERKKERKKCCTVLWVEVGFPEVKDEGDENSVEELEGGRKIQKVFQNI